MHAGNDNQNVCPPIMGCYTHWTFWGLFMLYVTFCLCTWGAKLCFCYESSQVFAPFHSFLFFSTVFAPKIPLPPRRAHRHQCIWRGSR